MNYTFLHTDRPHWHLYDLSPNGGWLSHVFPVGKWSSLLLGILIFHLSVNMILVFSHGEENLFKEISLWKHKVVLKRTVIFSLVFFNLYSLLDLLHFCWLPLLISSPVYLLNVEWLIEYLLERTLNLGFHSAIWYSVIANPWANLLSPLHCICICIWNW